MWIFTQDKELINIDTEKSITMQRYQMDENGGFVGSFVPTEDTMQIVLLEGGIDTTLGIYESYEDALAELSSLAEAIGAYRM